MLLKGAAAALPRPRPCSDLCSKSHGARKATPFRCTPLFAHYGTHSVKQGDREDGGSESIEEGFLDENISVAKIFVETKSICRLLRLSPH